MKIKVKVPSKDDVTDFTRDGQCIKCGACCSTFLPLTTKELKRLRTWAQKHKYRPTPILDALDITCPFLNKDTAECVCYDIRPEVCKVFLCKDVHEGNQPQLHKPAKRYEVVNLRQAIFKEESVSFAEFNLLRQYLDGKVAINKEKIHE